MIMMEMMMVVVMMKGETLNTRNEKVSAQET